MGWQQPPRETLIIPENAGPNDPVMILTSDELPPPVVADHYETGIMWRSLRPDTGGDQYWFVEVARRVPASAAGSEHASLARGWWLDGDDRWYVSQTDTALIVASGVNAVVHTTIDGDLPHTGPGGRFWTFVDMAEVLFFNSPVNMTTEVNIGTAPDPRQLDVWGELTHNGRSVGRGIQLHESTLGAAGVVGTATGAETVVWSPAATLDILQGRAYRFAVRGDLDSVGATQFATLRLRKTNIAGATGVAVTREVPASGTNVTFDVGIIWVRNGADIIGENWVVTLAGGSVPNPVRLVTDAGDARRSEITVEDVGAAADFPTAPAW